MSPRAAWRLEQLGFTEVYDFVHGKSFWLAHGLPTEGTGADRPRVNSVIDRDVPICLLGDTIATAQTRIMERPGWDQCIVTNHNGIVAGRLRSAHLEHAPDTVVDDVMEPGPTTIRPDTDLRQITERLRQRNAHSVVVTDPSGRLLGILRRS